MLWAWILQVQIRCFNMGQHSLLYLKNAPFLHFFKQNGQKAVNFILRYVKLHISTFLVIYVICISTMCAPSSYKGSKFGHAWVIFQLHIQEMTNWSPMLDLAWVMTMYLGKFNVGLSICISIFSIIHLLSKWWVIET